MSDVVSFAVPMSWAPSMERKIKEMELYKLETFETNNKCHTPGCFNDQAKTSDGEWALCKCGLYGVCEECKKKSEMNQDGCYCGGSVDKTCEPISIVTTRDNLVSLLQNQGVFPPPPEPEPETVYVYASGLGEPSEDSLKINIPLVSVSEAFDKERDPICLELDKETMMKQLSMSQVQELISAVSERSLNDKRALVEWFLEYNKLQSVDEAVRYIAFERNLENSVQEIVSRPELVRQVFDQALEKNVLEKSEWEEYVIKFHAKAVGVDPSIVYLDTPVEQPSNPEPVPEISSKKQKETVTFEEAPEKLEGSIKEMPELSVIKDRIVFDAPPKGEYTLVSPNTVDWLFPNELACVLRNGNLTQYLPEECLYQYVEKKGGFQVWTKGVGKSTTFNTHYKPLWNARDQLLDLIRFSYKKGLFAPGKNPRCPLGLTPEGRLRCLPHLFVASTGPGAKMLFEVLFDKLAHLSKECQSGENRPLEVLYNDFYQYGLKASRFKMEFLEKDNVTGRDLMILTTPGPIKKKREAKEPIQKKQKPGNNWLTLE